MERNSVADTLKNIAIGIGFIAIILGGVILLLFSIVQLARPLAVSQCSEFARVSGYETKFVDYNLMSYDCLAKKADGKWISTELLREVE